MEKKVIDGYRVSKESYLDESGTKKTRIRVENPKSGLIGGFIYPSIIYPQPITYEQAIEAFKKRDVMKKGGKITDSILAEKIVRQVYKGTNLNKPERDLMIKFLVDYLKTGSFSDQLIDKKQFEEYKHLFDKKIIESKRMKEGMIEVALKDNEKLELEIALDKGMKLKYGGSVLNNPALNMPLFFNSGGIINGFEINFLITGTHIL